MDNRFVSSSNAPLSYSSREVMQLTGISARQLQWWDERGIVSPQRVGRKRSYSQSDILELLVLINLRIKGFSLQALRRVDQYLHQELGHRLAEIAASDSDVHLLTDGNSIYIKDSAESVVDVLRHARQGMFAVCVTDFAREVFDVSRLVPRPEKKHPKNVAKLNAVTRKVS